MPPISPMWPIVATHPQGLAPVKDRLCTTMCSGGRHRPRNGSLWTTMSPCPKASSPTSSSTHRTVLAEPRSAG